MEAGNDERAPAVEVSFDVFLAYNSKDKDAVRHTQLIWEALEKNDARAWIDARDVIVGNAPTVEMAAGLEASKSSAILHGREGLGRWQNGFEMLVARKLAVTKEDYRLIPVLLPGSTENLPIELQVSSTLDLREDFSDEGLTEEGLLKLLAAVKGETLRARIEAQRRADRGRSRALLVGVSTYSGPQLKRLHGPLNDVDEFERALKEAEMPHGREWAITKCTNPDIEELRTALHRFFTDEAASGDTALFYYSGHGLVDEKDSYLCATNSDLDDRDWTTIPAEQIAQVVKKCAANAKVVILDCCHAARIKATAYNELEGDVAVIVASRGPAQDSDVVSEPSPFTSALVRVMGDPNAYGDAGLTVGGLLTALRRRGHEPWTNSRAGRQIGLAVRAGRSESPPARAARAMSIEIGAAAVPDDRLPLVKELVATLDALLAIPTEEGQMPTPIVSRGMQVLADEFRVVLTDEQWSALQAGPNERPETCAVRFADMNARLRLGDLPWEYLALHGRSATPEQLLEEATPNVSIERVFAVPGTKQAGSGVIQKVALFSSLGSAGDSDLHVLTDATKRHVQTLGLLSDADVAEAIWGVFRTAPDDADTIILQAPVRIEDNTAKVVFASDATRANPVPADSVAKELSRRTTLTRLFIETVATDSRTQPALAVRRLAQLLASRLKRPVVAICHSRAYLNCLRQHPEATVFLAELLRELDRGSALDRAAQVARDNVVSSLGLNDPAVIGFPIVIRPVEQEPQESQEPQRPVARRDDAP
jgi:hypothetical protein